MKVSRWQAAGLLLAACSQPRIDTLAPATPTPAPSASVAAAPSPGPAATATPESEETPTALHRNDVVLDFQPSGLIWHTPAIDLLTGHVAPDQGDDLRGDVAFLARAGNAYLLAVGLASESHRVAIQEVASVASGSVLELPLGGWLRESGWTAAYPELPIALGKVFGIRVTRPETTHFAALTIRGYSIDGVVFDYVYNLVPGDRLLD